MLANNFSINTNAPLFLKMKEPTLRGNLIFEDFLKAPKCSSSNCNLCLMNYKEKILEVRKAGKLLGFSVNPYTLKTVESLCRNQSPTRSSGEDCIRHFISSNTRDNYSLNNILYISNMIEFVNSNMFICLGKSEERIVLKNCNSVTFEHRNMFNK